MATNPDGSTYKPLYFYEVYDDGETIRGHLQDSIPAWEAEKRYEVVYHFRGRTADYWIATHDRSFTRDICLEFAVACHEGRVRKHNCNLEPLNR